MKRLLAVMALLSTLLPSVSKATVYGYWPGNSNGQVLDASGYGDDLTLVGTVTNPSLPTPPEGNRWLMQGPTSQLKQMRIPASAFNSDATGQISVYFWLSSTASINTGLFTIDSDLNGQAHLGAYIRASDGLLVVDYTNNNLQATVGTSLAAVNDGAKHLIRIKSDIASGIFLFVDGVSQFHNTNSQMFGSFFSGRVGFESLKGYWADSSTLIDAFQLGDSSADAFLGPLTPNTPTTTPTITLTATSSFTITPSKTVSLTFTTSPTPTPTLTATKTASPTSTSSPTFTATPSATPSSTRTATKTSTVSPTPTTTNTPSPAATAVASATPGSVLILGQPLLVEPLSSDGVTKVFGPIQPGPTPSMWNQSAPGYAYGANLTPSTGSLWVNDLTYAVENDSTFTSLTYASSTFASGNSGASASAVFLTLSSRCNVTFYNSGTTTAFLLFSNSATAPTDTNLHYKVQIPANGSWTEDQPLPYGHFFAPTPVATGSGNIHISHKIADTRGGTTYAQ